MNKYFNKFSRCLCENVENGCESMYQMSLNNYNTFVELDGSQIMQTTQGYTNILNLIIKENKEAFYSRLRLAHSLYKIFVCNKLSSNNQNNNSSCSHCLYTNDKNKIVLLFKVSSEIENDLKKETKNNEYVIVLCDNVVCTMSLGYLKENLNSLIEPSTIVPEEKRVAVQRLGYGTINKVSLLVYIFFY